jgi:hypothetical protein
MYKLIPYTRSSLFIQSAGAELSTNKQHTLFNPTRKPLTVNRKPYGRSSLFIQELKRAKREVEADISDQRQGSMGGIHSQKYSLR